MHCQSAHILHNDTKGKIMIADFRTYRRIGWSRSRALVLAFFDTRLAVRLWG